VVVTENVTPGDQWVKADELCLYFRSLVVVRGLLTNPRCPGSVFWVESQASTCTRAPKYIMYNIFNEKVRGSAAPGLSVCTLSAAVPLPVKIHTVYNIYVIMIYQLEKVHLQDKTSPL